MKNHFHYLLLIFLIHIPQFTEAQQGSWLEEIARQGSPHARHEAGFVAVNNKFYLLGGRGIKPVNIYDPITKVWTNGQAPPIELHHFQPLAYQGKIYAIGAMTGKYPGETPVPNIIIYDPQSDTWSNGPNIPVNRRRGGAGLVLYNNKFYLVCGIIDGHRGGHVNWMDVYDPATNSWRILEDAPRARDHFQASEIQGKIYAVAGRRSTAGKNVFGNTVSAVDVYDIASGKWTTLNQPLPTQRAGTYNAVYQQYILVFGGESPNQEASHAEVEGLDSQTGLWTSFSSMIRGRHGTGTAWYKDTIFIASGSGGRGGGPELNTQDKFFFGGTSTERINTKDFNPFRIFPSPQSFQNLEIHYDGPLRNIDLQLYTLSGKLIAEKHGLSSFPLRWDLGTQSLDKGLYLLQVKNETDTFSSKVFLD